MIGVNLKVCESLVVSRLQLVCNFHHDYEWKIPTIIVEASES